MEKKFISIIMGTIVFVFLIISVIVQFLPFIITISVIAGIIFLIKKSYNEKRESYASVGSFIIVPVLLLGWAYIGYLAYTNLYYQTYVITDSYTNKSLFAEKTFTAKSDEDAIVKAWEYSIEKCKDRIDNVEHRFDFGLEKKYIYNRTTDESVDIYNYKSTYDSLYYNNGKITLRPYDFFY